MDILGPEIAAQSAYDQLSRAKQSFVDCYLSVGEIRKAYEGVFPGARDFTQAYRWARDPLIQAALAERMATLAERTDITLHNVLREIGVLAFSNIKNYLNVDEGGTPRWNFENVTHEQWAAVSEVSVKETVDDRGRPVRDIKLKLHDKNSALDKLMKRFGAYAPERHELSGPNGSPIPVKATVVTVNMTPSEAAEQYTKLLRGE